MNNFKARFSLLKAGLFFLAITLLLSLAFLFASPQSVQAGGTVATCDEASLLAALSGGGTVIFTCDGTITLTNPIIIAANTTLDATGHNVTISGNNAVRIFYVNMGINFTINKLTLTQGKMVETPAKAFDGGGAIYNNKGTVTISNTNFVSNQVTNDNTGNITATGGAIYNYFGTITINDSNFSNNNATGIGGSSGGGGAIYNTDTIIINNCNFTNNKATGASGAGGAIGYGGSSGGLTINNSTFVGNSATGSNGGPSRDGGGWGSGGAIGLEVGFPTTIISNTSFINNTAKGGDAQGSGNGGQGSGGAIFAQRPISITGSTFVNNTAVRGAGVGPSSYYPEGGGAIFNDYALQVINSTFSNNAAIAPAGIPSSGGAIFSSYNGYNTPASNIINSTFFNNTATIGNSIFNDNFSRALIVKNTIFATNLASENCYTRAAAILTDGGNNLQWPGTSCGNTISSQDPKLGPLQNNGGPTQTHLPAPNSPAIDAGNNATCAASPVNNLDQRGVTRPVGTNCDIGAVEFEACALPLAVNSNQDNGACGTLRYAVDYLSTRPNNTDKTINLTALPAASIITLSNSGLSLPVGVSIQGRCLNNKPDITISASGVTGNGVTLGGGNILIGLKVTGFGGKQIFTAGKGNQLSCVVASKT